MANSTTIYDYTLRGNYPNYYCIKFFVKYRNSSEKQTPGIGYIPAEVEYWETKNSKPERITVEFADIPFLCQNNKEKGKEYLSYLLGSMKDNKKASRKVNYYREQYLTDKEWYYKDVKFTENKYVVPSSTKKKYDIFHISHKGANLLELIKEGYPVPDFSILTTDWFSLEEDKKEQHIRAAVRNLEQMTNESLDKSGAPLVIAIRCAMPQYIPGLMPTYLNAGVVPESFNSLKSLYGSFVAGRIYLNNLLTLYSLLYHDKDIAFLKEKQYHTSISVIYKKIQTYYDLIMNIDERLLNDPYYQIQFLLNKACNFFQKNKELPYTLIKKKTYPSFILQKMVWTIRDDDSYPGILYSRHSRTGLGKQIESYRNIFGEDIMSGTVETEDNEYFDREEIKENFPAVYHFSPLLSKLEVNQKSPVTVEFAAESYANTHLFAVLQLNKAELTGRACLLSAIDLYKKGIISKDNVIKLVQPYHLRQIFSDTIEKKSLSDLIYFSEGVSVLPRSAISVKIYFSANSALDAKKKGEKVCFCKEHFVPSDTIVMKEVDAIISLNPAAIHVITACRGYGIPAFLNLENYGIRLKNNTLINSRKTIINEGDWVTLSSKKKTIYIGKATFTPARFRKYLEGEKLKMKPKEETVFKNMADAYNEYQTIVNSLDYSDISSLNELTKFIRIDLDKDRKKASKFINNWFDENSEYYMQQILKSQPGTHQDQHKLYKLLSLDRQIALYKKAIKYCFKNNLKGYKAGSFMLGRFICISHKTEFWKSFSAEEIVFMLNEYILFEKYIHVLYEVGERNINRAKTKILEHGLGEIIINKGNAKIFMPLKLITENRNALKEKLTIENDKETSHLINLLTKPYGYFYDYSVPWSIDHLKKICDEENIKLPDENEI